MSILEVNATRVHERLDKIVAFFADRYAIPEWTDDSDRDTIDEIMTQWTRFMDNVIVWAREYTSVYPVTDRATIVIATRIEQLIREIIREKRRLFLYRASGRHRFSFVTLTHYALAHVACLANRGQMLRQHGKKQTHSPEFIRYSVVCEDIFKMTMAHLDATRWHLAKIWRNEPWSEDLVLYVKLLEMRTFELIVFNQTERILNKVAYSLLARVRNIGDNLFRRSVGDAPVSTETNEEFPSLPDYTTSMITSRDRENCDTMSDSGPPPPSSKGKAPLVTEHASVAPPRHPTSSTATTTEHIVTGPTVFRFAKSDPSTQCDVSTKRVLIAAKELDTAKRSGVHDNIAAAQKRYDMIHEEEQQKYVEAMRKFNFRHENDKAQEKLLDTGGHTSISNSVHHRHKASASLVTPPAAWKYPNDIWVSDNFFFFRAAHNSIYYASKLALDAITVDSITVLRQLTDMSDVISTDSQMKILVATATEYIHRTIKYISDNRWNEYTEAVAFDLSTSIAQDDMLRYRHPLKDTKPHSIAYMFNPREFNSISEYAQQSVEALFNDKRSPASLKQFIQLLAVKSLVSRYSRVIFEEYFVFGDDELDDAARARVQSIPVFVKTFHTYQVFYHGIAHRFEHFEWAIVFWALQMYKISTMADPTDITVPVCGIRNICIDFFPDIADHFQFVSL